MTSLDLVEVGRTGRHADESGVLETNDQTVLLQVTALAGSEEVLGGSEDTFSVFVSGAEDVKTDAMSRRLQFWATPRSSHPVHLKFAGVERDFTVNVNDDNR